MYNHVSSFQDTFFYDIRKEECKIKEWIALLHNFKHFSGISCCWFALPQEPEEAAPSKSCFWFLLDCRSSWETRKVPLGSSLSFRPWLGLAAFTILWLKWGRSRLAGQHQSTQVWRQKKKEPGQAMPFWGAPAVCYLLQLAHLYFTTS